MLLLLPVVVVVAFWNADGSGDGGGWWWRVCAAWISCVLEMVPVFLCCVKWVDLLSVGSFIHVFFMHVCCVLL